MSGELEALPGGRGRRKGRKRYTAEEKVAILRRHLVDRVPVSDLCDEVGLSPTAFYRWRKEFFENGAAAFQKERQASPPVERDIQTKPFYRAGFLCVVLAVLKLTTGVHWSWWRVLLPLWVVVGYSLLHIATGFIWLSIVASADVRIRESNRADFYQPVGLLCMLAFLDNLLRRIGPGESVWWWLASGRSEVLVMLGVLSVGIQFLYWRQVVQKTWSRSDAEELRTDLDAGPGHRQSRL